MRIKSGQDLATGLLFIVVGVAAIWIGADYPMGTAQRPGTGVLPRILAWCLIGTGALLWLKAAMTNGPGLTRWAWRPVIMVALATVAFALLVDRLGLIVAMLVSMTLAALGTPQTRWLEYTLFALLMVGIGVGMFIYGLRMPIPILPKGLPEALPWK
jgi:putative tricarboxylic transport membrane protein